VGFQDAKPFLAGARDAEPVESLTGDDEVCGVAGQGGGFGGSFPALEKGVVGEQAGADVGDEGAGVRRASRVRSSTTASR
jgi:hypothetical protein